MRRFWWRNWYGWVSVRYSAIRRRVLDIYDELYKNAHRIENIITAHEQGAAHAADGYARVTGKPGVVIATSGPGAPTW